MEVRGDKKEKSPAKQIAELEKKIADIDCAVERVVAHVAGITIALMAKEIVSPEQIKAINKDYTEWTINYRAEKCKHQGNEYQES